MTMDRFFAIVYSLESRPYRIRRNGFKICLVVWAVTVCLTAPIFIYAGVHHEGTPQCKVEFPGYENQFATNYEEIYEDYNFEDSISNSTNVEYSGSADDENNAYNEGL